MTGHTPGPWEALPWERESGGQDWNIWGPRPSNHPGHPDLEGDVGSEADARLIAAAPEMLAALKDARSAVAVMTNDEGERDAPIQNLQGRLDTAIAKAEGQESK